MPDDGATTFTKEQVDAAVTAAVTAAVDKETGGLKSKNADLLGKLAKAKPILDAIGELDPDTIKSRLQLATDVETERSRKAGEFDKLKEQLVVQHKTELEKVTGRVQTLEGSLFDVLGEQRLTEILTPMDGDPTLLLPHMKPFVKITENPNATSAKDRFVAVVVDKGGTPRVKDGQGTPFGLQDLADEFKADTKFGKAWGPGKETGSGSTTDGRPGSTQGATHRISWEDAQDVEKYRNAMEAATKAKAKLVIDEPKRRSA